MKSWKKKQKQAAKLIKKWRLEDLNMKSGLYMNTLTGHTYEIAKMGKEEKVLYYRCFETFIVVISPYDFNRSYKWLMYIGEV